MAQIQNFDVFGIVKANMLYNSEQQKTIADNLARAHVPYEFEEYLEPFDAKSLYSTKPSVILSMTNGQHIEGKTPGINVYFPLKVNRDMSEVTPNGNNIVATEQMEKLGRNKLQHAASVNVYMKLRDMQRKASEG